MILAQQVYLSNPRIGFATPPLLDVMNSVPGSGRGHVAARQLALEPSVAGVDRAMSWSVWVCASNIGTDEKRILCVSETAVSALQYSLSINSQQTTTAAFNQKLIFTLFTTDANSIAIDSTNRFLLNRWTHIVITYSGSETSAGLEMYINGVHDTTANKRSAGTYTGARNTANMRYQISFFPASPARRYGGDYRDMAVWDKVLDSTEVAELYNNGRPIDVNTVSFYAANIEAYWPLRTTTTCLNDSAFNFTNVASIATRSTPVGPSYQKMSIMKADIANTRYLAFGNPIKLPNGSFAVWTRSGTAHLTAGNIIKMVLDKSTYLAGSPVTVIDDATWDIRGGSAGIVDDANILFLAARYNSGGAVWVDLLRYQSTDGLTGETFGAGTAMTTDLAAYNFYGKLIDGDSAGEYFVPEYEANTGPYVSNQYVWKRDSGGTWTKHTVVAGGTEDYGEGCLLRVGPLDYIMLLRSETVVGLHYTRSTDGCATWSVPVPTGLGTGLCNADMVLNANGQINLIFMDRALSRAYVSVNNPVASILADPTDWVAPSAIFESYPTDSTNILGYPSIISDDGHYFLITISAEFSASVADLYWGYGHFGLG